jgi:hypothetical protein
MQANANITIMYDLSRAKCDHRWVHGVDTWRVEMGYTINGVVQDVEPIAWIEHTGYPQVYRTPLISNVPEGDIELWFTCSNGEQIVYDSDHGHNFKFRMEKYL